ncbi:hypothetical protein J1614_007028 [Plenodomus biglobosus]|nr:hypothetical protein J1614_007028 [Plenodomus biglobosus]
MQLREIADVLGKLDTFDVEALDRNIKITGNALAAAKTEVERLRKEITEQQKEYPALNKDLARGRAWTMLLEPEACRIETVFLAWLNEGWGLLPRMKEKVAA